MDLEEEKWFGVESEADRKGERETQMEKELNLKVYGEKEMRSEELEETKVRREQKST